MIIVFELIYFLFVISDTSFNIKQSIVLCQRIARERGYHFDISFGYVDINQELKFPDWFFSLYAPVRVIETIQRHIIRWYRYGIPQNNGNPPPGQFDYGEDHDPHITEYTYAIPWPSSWNNHDLYIAARTVVWIWGICP